jgi:hypothetical protein
MPGRRADVYPWTKRENSHTLIGFIKKMFAASNYASPGENQMPQLSQPVEKIKHMGDKSPKSNQKKSSQKQSKSSSADQKKKQAVAAKQAAGKKK